MERFRKHLPEYLMEAAELGLFLIAAGVFTCVFEYPGSPIHQAIPNGDLRRFLIGVVMGTIAITLIYSPWGKQSGAHILSSGKSQTSGCYFLYSVSKFGRIVWGLFGDIIVGSGVHQSAVNYIVTVPILLAQIFAKLTFLGRIHPVSTGVEPS